MVGTLLGLPEPPVPDHAADALAVAICHGGRSAADAEISVTRAPKVGEAGYAENLIG
jgi:Holliday junction resolvasome RuvABC endonuclease subunit